MSKKNGNNKPVDLEIGAFPQQLYRFFRQEIGQDWERI